jgi:hypothetical protein
MGNIEFEEPTVGANYKRKSQKGMVGLLMKFGITRSENIANIILVCISIFFFTMSFVVYSLLSK